jgi:hypothetical protein
MMTDMEEAVLTIDRVFQDIITNNNKTS